MFCALDQHLAVVGDSQLDAGERLADGAELVAVDRLERRRGRRLRHAVALEHGHAAGEEELEDLLRDRRGAGDRLADVAAEGGADLGEQLLLGLVERLLQLRRNRLAGELAARAP